MRMTCPVCGAVPRGSFLKHLYRCAKRAPPVTAGPDPHVVELCGAARSKYGNVKVLHDGLRFDSKKEFERWLVLQAEEREGEIRGLERQVPWDLLVSGKKVAVYVADFCYERQTPVPAWSIMRPPGSVDWRPVVEDVKGFKTRVFKLKARMFSAQYGFSITCV